MRPTLSKRKIYDGDEPLVDLWNHGVRLNGELLSRITKFFGVSSEDYENFICLVGPAVKKKNYKRDAWQ